MQTRPVEKAILCTVYCWACIAAAGQCSNEYVTTGVSTYEIEMGNDAYPDAAPAFGCLTPPGGNPQNCLLSRGFSVFSNGFDGEIDGTDANDGVYTAIARVWDALIAYYQVTLDQAYADGERYCSHAMAMLTCAEAPG
jgi:hypothetical protein